jgi:serine/threonine-protein phosphatase PPG1
MYIGITKETRQVTMTYGFYAEVSEFNRQCNKKYGNANVWTYWTDLFDYMVLSVLIDDTILCVHGGIRLLTQACHLHCTQSTKLKYWTGSGKYHTKDQYQTSYGRTHCHQPIQRNKTFAFRLEVALTDLGAGYVFGKNVTRKFLHTNSLGHICRAHQLCMEGYQV